MSSERTLFLVVLVLGLAVAILIGSLIVGAIREKLRARASSRAFGLSIQRTQRQLFNAEDERRRYELRRNAVRSVFRAHAPAHAELPEMRIEVRQ